MKTVQITKLMHPVTASVAIPGSLSQTIRALIIASFVKEKVRILHPVKSDDVFTMVTLLRDLGIQIAEENDAFIVIGNIRDIPQRNHTVTANISGRTARSALALLTLIPGIKVLNCDQRFKRRPIGELVHALRQLGAEIEYLEKENYLPVKIISDRLHEGEIVMRGDLSSQYVSAILLIAPLIGAIRISVTGEQASKPFIAMTIGLMQEFGIHLVNENYTHYYIPNGQEYKAKSSITIEADAIAATYFWAIAALTKSKIRVQNISPDSKQGDVHFYEILQRMGAKIQTNTIEQWIEVEGTDTLRGISVNMNDLPDSVLTLAVLASFARGKTEIRGIGHLTIKESDRLHAPREELHKMGISVTATADMLSITGGAPQSAVIATHGDHRMAMAFAVAGTQLPKGLVIEHPEVVGKSFPNYWEKLTELGISVREGTR